MSIERIHRIETMERLLDEVLAADSFDQVERQLNALYDYYFGPLWMEDYAADEAGLLPDNLKRGVLSQDTLYDLLTEWDSSCHKQAARGLQFIYDLLKDKYPLSLTNTFALDEGFTEDMPILCGKAGGKVFWLYWDDPDFVFSYEVPHLECHNHCHPQNVYEAIECIESFITKYES